MGVILGLVIGLLIPLIWKRPLKPVFIGVGFAFAALGLVAPALLRHVYILWMKIGAVLGALIYGMVRQGVVFAGIDADWVSAVLGAMLLIAVLVNRYVRQRALGVRG